MSEKGSKKATEFIDLQIVSYQNVQDVEVQLNFFRVFRCASKCRYNIPNSIKNNNVPKKKETLSVSVILYFGHTVALNIFLQSVIMLVRYCRL